MKQIRFNTGELPYTIMAESKNYIICQRPIDKKEDIDLLKHEVEMGAYLSVDSALSALKNTPIYTILDIKNKIAIARVMISNKGTTGGFQR